MFFILFVRAVARILMLVRFLNMDERRPIQQSDYVFHRKYTRINDNKSQNNENTRQIQQ